MPNSVAIELDRRHGDTFTCLDVVKGNVRLYLSSEETLTHIQVKMEAVSRSSLVVPKHPGRDKQNSKKTVTESHKLLYVTQILFPPEDVRNLPDAKGTGKDGFTLAPGQYYYPFEFRIPINNNCLQSSSFISKFTFSDGANFNKDPRQHIKTTLPPSLSDMNEATIKYFFKVTVKKAAFYKINMRQYNPFIFLPFEPPRPSTTGQQFFVRRKHRFNYTPVSGRVNGSIPSQKKKGFFSSLTSTARPSFLREAGPEFYVEARMPDPPIVVPTEKIPLRLFVRSEQQFTAPIYLHSLQINLVSHTLVAAQEHNKDIAFAVTIVKLQNMKLPMTTMTNPAPQVYEAEFDKNKWSNAFLPSTVPPTFKTCNIGRHYSMEIFLVVSHGPYGDTDTVALAFDVNVYSGISPPEALLRATEEARLQAAIPNPYQIGPAVERTLSTTQPTASTSANGKSRPAESSSAPPADSLPTYDEAIASKVMPVSGPRRNFQQSPNYYANMDDIDRDEK
ncbi:hypothetical protein POJ06DRAFT_249019 [Lipomyces tetrasporus]|uniref:Arrestin-like N-terminal domain-containing protein n=1 Tax=Lipomyces tetrasporus TaxID=54092 RepID=A0AAD7QYJ9_9ASCO|nr:uncharacterized protein POJ06DRAFT_249019 [Lipomyces tetrasporus]KAJ8102182.1 hypothetical protein POJ06DRAFT_249019 [Lipomyces tetrasporus]